MEDLCVGYVSPVVLSNRLIDPEWNLLWHCIEFDAFDYVLSTRLLHDLSQLRLKLLLID